MNQTAIEDTASLDVTHDVTRLGRTELWFADLESDVRRCYPVMAQLRPHLACEEEFIERWGRQKADGYRLMVLSGEGRPVALAGFRVQENLVYGRFLYVDDLATDESLRSLGLGEIMMKRLKEEAAALGCAKLVLDTPLSNALGHRFYFRNGLLATSLRFNTPISAPGTPSAR